MHARTRDGLVAVHEVLSLAEAIEKHRHRADIESVRSEPHQVIQDSRDLVEHDADVLGAFRNFDAEKFFDRHDVGMLVAHHRHVVEAIHVTNTLVERLGFCQLFRGAMQQTDVRIRFLDDLALDLEYEAQHAVRRRMLRTKIHRVALDFSHR
jgi:hypothetical protein